MEKILRLHYIAGNWVLSSYKCEGKELVYDITEETGSIRDIRRKFGSIHSRYNPVFFKPGKYDPRGKGIEKAEDLSVKTTKRVLFG